jgi:beta-galactosidase
MELYGAIRRFGPNVDIIPSDAPLDAYRCVVIPNLVHVPPSLVKRLSQFKGQILIGPRSGSKTIDLQIPEALPPGPLQELIPLQVTRVESLPPQIHMPVTIAGQTCSATCWREEVRTDIVPSARFDDGWGVLYQHRNTSYLTAWLDARGLQAVIAKVLKDSALKVSRYQEAGLRTSKLGDLIFAFNYGPDIATLDENHEFLIGQRSLKPTEIAVWKA